MGLARHLNDIEANLRIVKEFPELAGVPVILGESDPEGCAACSMRTHPENAYRNGPLYGAYVVEAIARTYELSRREGVAIEGSVMWAFLFEGQPYFEGFRDLATNGIDKPVLNAFRMLGMLGGQWLEATSSHRRCAPWAAMSRSRFPCRGRACRWFAFRGIPEIRPGVRPSRVDARRATSPAAAARASRRLPSPPAATCPRPARVRAPRGRCPRRARRCPSPAAARVRP